MLSDMSCYWLTCIWTNLLCRMPQMDIMLKGRYHEPKLIIWYSPTITLNTQKKKYSVYSTEHLEKCCLLVISEPGHYNEIVSECNITYTIRPNHSTNRLFIDTVLYYMKGFQIYKYHTTFSVLHQSNHFMI
jgi:hypothetical protein